MREVKKHSILRETNRTILFTGLNALVNIAFFGFAARTLDVANFGMELQIISAAGAIAGLLDFGTSYFFLRELSSGRTNIDKLKGAFFGRTFIVAFCCVPLIFFAALTSSFYLIQFALLLNIQMILQFVTVPMRARGNTSVLSRSLLQERILSLIVLVIVSRYFSNPPITLIIFVTTLISTLSLLRTRIILKRFCLSNTEINWNPWRQTLGIGSTQVLSQIQQLDLNLLASLTSSTVAATYGAVARWTNALGIFATGFSQSIVPSASRPNFDKFEVRELKKASLWLIMAILCSLTIFAFAPQIVTLVLGGKYQDSSGILRVLAIATVASTFTQPSAAYLQAKGLNIAVFASLATGIILQVSTIIIFYEKLGPYSAAYGFLIGQFVAATMLFLTLLRYKISPRN